MGRSPAQQEKSRMLREWFLATDRPDLTNAQIAEQIGTSLITVERIRRELGRRKEYAPYKGFPSKLDDWFKVNHDAFSDKDLAARYGVTRSCILAWRRKLGIRKDRKSVWKLNPHPRGHLGCKHSQKTVAAMIAGTKAAWKNPNSKFNSEEFRQRRSDYMTYFRARRTYQPYSRSNSGTREDLGLFVRSTWEANYARYLNWLKSKGEIHDWKYEADTFWFEKIKRGTRSYTPDFKIWEKPDSTPYYIEVKGYMDQKSRTKLDRMKRYHPNVRIVLVEASDYYKLRAFSRLIPGWEIGTKKMRPQE